MNDYPKRGEVYLVNLDPTIGTEMSKVRPCVIISNNTGNKFSSRVTIAAITSRGIDKIFKIEVVLEANEGGLKERSKVALDQIRSIDKKRLSQCLGELSAEKIKKIDKAIKVSLALE